jgi:hypothetical protein
MEPRPVEEMFEWVYADPPDTLVRQRGEVLGRLAGGLDGDTADG